MFLRRVEIHIVIAPLTRAFCLSARNDVPTTYKPRQSQGREQKMPTHPSIHSSPVAQWKIHVAMMAHIELACEEPWTRQSHQRAMDS